jgi:hypothetical protein
MGVAARGEIDAVNYLQDKTRQLCNRFAMRGSKIGLDTCWYYCQHPKNGEGKNEGNPAGILARVGTKILRGLP